MNAAESEGEVASIRARIRNTRQDVDDADLRSEMQSWLMESHERVDADSAPEYVEARLTAMLEDNEMFNTPTSTNPSDEFPDECEGCDHYGAACPILTGPVEPDYRERKLAEAQTDAEAKRIYQEQAKSTGCHRIPEYLSEWNDNHEEFVRRGEELLYRAEENIEGLRQADGEVSMDL